MRKIIYTRTDGGLTVVTPALNIVEPEGFTEADAEQRAWDRLPDDAINPQWVDAAVIPNDRTFRNAWKAGNGCVEHDMAKCREIHKDKLRQMRAPKMAALDVEYMQADEAGDSMKKAQVAAKKRALRDVTKDPAIDAAQTHEELKTVLPSVLK